MDCKKEKKKIKRSTLLIALCWLVYTCSYLGKLGYNANVTKIESVFAVSHSTAGMVSTFFFFAYGIGQIINGFFCKKYPLRTVVFGSLFVSGLMNILVGFSKNFALVKYFWLINGAALSILWPSLIRLLSETLDKKDLAKAVVTMGTTVATGTCIIYGISALFVQFGSYVMTFFLAGTLLAVISFVWFFAFPRLVEKKEFVEETLPIQQKKSNTLKGLMLPLVLLASFAVVDNLVKDGLTTWVPAILKETYSLRDSTSILLTVILPVLAIFGAVVAATLHKKIKDFVLLSAVFFASSAALIGVTILCLPTGLFVITLISFALVSCLMSAVNNVITSMAPLYWKDRVNSGKMAGILNGFCYLGSTLSTYGLGLLADNSGWTSVFWLLLALCVAAALIGAIYALTLGKKKMRGKCES